MMSESYWRGFESPARWGWDRRRESRSGRWIRRGDRIVVFTGSAEPGMDAGGPEFENFAAPVSAPACDNRDFPVLRVRTPKPVTRDRVHCDAPEHFSQVAQAVRNAVQMLDSTIAEFVTAREAACRGEVLEERHLQPVTVCWLKYKLGVCIDDPAVWTAGTMQNGSVAEVIRRLMRPRDLLANNEITYMQPGCHRLQCSDPRALPQRPQERRVYSRLSYQGSRAVRTVFP